MKKNDSGFTLVELICVIAILGLITVSIFTFILSGMGMAKETKKSAALSENARTTINKMKTDIMNCSGCVIGSNEITTSSDGTLVLAAESYGDVEDLGETFFLLTRENTGNSYTVNCYKYDGNGKIYYGRAKGVAMSSTLDTASLTDKCAPTHVLCDNVSEFKASVFPVGETVTKSSESTTTVTGSDGSAATVTSSDGSTDSETEFQIKAKRIHIVLTLDKDNKNFHTQQDAAIRSDVRYFGDVKKAADALNK